MQRDEWGTVVRLVLNGTLKQAAQLRTTRWEDIMVVEDGAPYYDCRLAIEEV